MDDDGSVVEHSAHRVVLAAASDYFRQVFTSNAMQQVHQADVRPVLCVPAGVTSRQLDLVLEYLYAGKVNVAGGKELSTFFSACRAMRNFGHEEDAAEDQKEAGEGDGVLPVATEEVGFLN